MDFRAAKSEAKASAGRISRAWTALIGSRVLVATAAMFALAFAMTIIVSPPSRFPPIGVPTAASVGLPIGIDLEKERQAAQEIIDAAKRQGANERTNEFVSRYPQAIPIINWTGLLISLGLLGVGLAAQARLYRRGVSPL